MKKILALFLILATLAPMAMIQPANAAVEKEPSFERRLDYDISQSHKRKT